MQGFFAKSETKSLKASGKGTCYSCKLFKGCKSPKMDPQGNFKKRIMIIGEFPDSQADNRAKAFAGNSGNLLRKVLSENGVDLDEDCISLNAVNCNPGDTVVTGVHIGACRDVKVMKAILKYKPKGIILLGSMAVTSVIGNRWHKSLGNITKWRGWRIPDQELGTWICPTLHPHYITTFDSKEMETVFRQDIYEAVQQITHVTFPTHVEPKINYIDVEELSKIDFNGTRTAFDYEASGIKPQANGHRVVCASIATSENEVYVFDMPDKKKPRTPFIKYLENQNCEKIASNMKYEDHWSFVRMRAEVQNWFYDTMIGAHILDSRPGITGLKFQAYVRLGVIDYSSHIEPFLKSTDKKTNGMNTLVSKRDEKEFMKELKKYCALDSIYEYRVAMLQLQELEQRILPF